MPPPPPRARASGRGGEGSGPLEEGPWLGWRAPGLFPGLWGRGGPAWNKGVPPEGHLPDHSGGRHALHSAQAFFLMVPVLDPPTPG